MLGEIHQVRGACTVDGRLAYVSQEAWIQRATVRDNVLFSSMADARTAVDDAHYGRVLDACQLLPDLALLPQGDATEIGERGITLSGGQKARVSLALAMYRSTFTSWTTHGVRWMYMWRALSSKMASTASSVTRHRPRRRDGACGREGQQPLGGSAPEVCIARALLRRSRVVVLDEATANIDIESDRLIQETLKTCFDGVTMLVIAHRLDTILDSDRILVMQDGGVLEFDAPDALLARPESTFAALAKHSKM
ncbi:Aste57867_629 [Aphanomyces stellatus]|uniref:Aste57867_629 protein n=1 Tax=Aphanomyces stellatus TaxID=120398 RepID=A0A485K774_9STRA|nr:hypothetical protein As57867_000628 [Aphanomyces stellatus]VFT77854.1 Aste57867_629 [Aphanomyces stellatus]